MPIGIITDVSTTLCGALLGCVLSSRLGDNWKKLLNDLLGIAALVMGIVLIIRAKNLSAVILALLLGACAGEALRLEDRIYSVATAVTGKLMGGGADAAYLAKLCKIKEDIKGLNLLPALIFVFFVSAAWTAVIG